VTGAAEKGWSLLCNLIVIASEPHRLSGTAGPRHTHTVCWVLHELVPKGPANGGLEVGGIHQAEFPLQEEMP
jgi:hypothetical protein